MVRDWLKPGHSTPAMVAISSFARVRMGASRGTPAGLGVLALVGAIGLGMGGPLRAAPAETTSTAAQTAPAAAPATSESNAAGAPGIAGAPAEKAAGGHGGHGGAPEPIPPAELLPQEVHLKNLKQLTFGGENAEAYFSFDGKRLSFQSRRDGARCDSIYTMKIDGSDVQKVSSGEGTTTCSYYTPDGKSVVYASTHMAGPECPPKADMSQGYVWDIYAQFDIFKKDLKTGRITRLTDTPGYDAEATISPDGKRIVFTSVRDGDLDLYTMDLDGKNVKRVTNTPGYDGGAFFSHDSKKLVWRASRPEGEALSEYQALLKDAKVRPTKLEIVVGNADGSDARQLTSNGAANFAPFFLPDDSGVVFVSNVNDPKKRNFDVYSVKLDGSEVSQVTFSSVFDGFPMFSPDGKKLVFASNRGGKERGDTNVFIADWVP